MFSVLNTPICCSVRAACHALGVGRTTVYALLAEGQLTGIRIRGRRLIIVESVTALVKARSGRGVQCGGITSQAVTE